MPHDTGKQADLFLRCLESRDFDAARAMCAEAAVVWQNDGEGEQPLRERLNRFESFAEGVVSMRYEVLRQFPKPTEVLQQQVLHLTLSDGTSSEGPATVYFRFTGDLIDRVEECLYTVPAEQGTP
ncbi:nuclear transport factor 2 family protein (plasmid) [Streptomyces sp. BI20]|uniref:nuclear transport factor 2 family protein n=1 Tax=Streptomyces sp. BI20 TaxID=3403460 RepID=UPI003C712F63